MPDFFPQVADRQFGPQAGGDVAPARPGFSHGGVALDRVKHRDPVAHLFDVGARHAVNRRRPFGEGRFAQPAVGRQIDQQVAAIEVETAVRIAHDRPGSQEIVPARPVGDQRAAIAGLPVLQRPTLLKDVAVGLQEAIPIAFGARLLDHLVHRFCFDDRTMVVVAAPGDRQVAAFGGPCRPFLPSLTVRVRRAPPGR